MKQLLMYYIPDGQLKENTLPEGYSFSKITDIVPDRDDWVRICAHGLVGEGDAGRAAFDAAIMGMADINPFEDLYFLDYNGEHVATFTAFVHSDDNTGDYHMVSVRTDFRGKGLSKYLCNEAINVLTKRKVRYIHLTTDEFRIPAVKSYIKAGFLPVNWDDDMEDRWLSVIKKAGIPEVPFLNEDSSFFKMLKADMAKNICVFLGSRSGNDEIYTEKIRELGHWIGNSGYNLIYGGSKTGLMGEIAKSTIDAGGKVKGIQVRRFYDKNYQADFLTKLVITETFAERKNRMIDESDCFVVFPGGPGTLDELSEVFVGLSMETLNKPLVFFNVNGYYDDLRKMFDKMFACGFTSGEWINNVSFASDIGEIESFLSGKL